MSEKEYKDKCEAMFKKNAILISENEHLKEQIEKMKCCGNCRHFSFPLNVCYAHEHQVWKTFEDTIPCGKWELAKWG